MVTVSGRKLQTDDVFVRFYRGDKNTYKYNLLFIFFTIFESLQPLNRGKKLFGTVQVQK